MYNFELFFDPRKLITEAIQFPEGEPEMSEFESAFLCGLIKEKKPKKIVEVGIAAGGTTSIILQCLKSLGINESTELHSVDISELFYRGNGEKSGYLAEQAKEKIDSSFNHTYHLGQVIPNVLDQIGNGIDFVILDTTHALPGEILDFIVLFPYLAPNACIILHDIANNHYGNSTSAFATQLLLDTVTAIKIIEHDNDRELLYPNIGAFILNNDTLKYIKDVFNSLMISWNYIPEQNVLQAYLDSVKKSYGIEFQQLLTTIYQLQLNTCKRHSIIENTTVEKPSWKKRIMNKTHRYISYIPRKFKMLLKQIAC